MVAGPNRRGWLMELRSDVAEVRVGLRHCQGDSRERGRASAPALHSRVRNAGTPMWSFATPGGRVLVPQSVVLVRPARLHPDRRGTRVAHLRVRVGVARGRVLPTEPANLHRVL